MSCLEVQPSSGRSAWFTWRSPFEPRASSPDGSPRACGSPPLGELGFHLGDIGVLHLFHTHTNASFSPSLNQGAHLLYGALSARDLRADRRTPVVGKRPFEIARSPGARPEARMAAAAGNVRREASAQSCVGIPSSFPSRLRMALRDVVAISTMPVAQEGREMVGTRAWT